MLKTRLKRVIESAHRQIISKKSALLINKMTTDTYCISENPSTDIILYQRETIVDYSLFDPQLTRAEVAKELNISLRSLYDYLTFGGENNPYLRKYLSVTNGLNRKKIDSTDIDYIQEIADLRKRFTKDRVVQILRRKYGDIA